MQITVTARQCDIGPELRAFAQTRLEKLAKYDEAVREVRVIISHERKLHTVELTVHVHHQDIIITESHAEPGAALELAADRLEDRIRRAKEKRVSAPRREGRGDAPQAPSTDVGDDAGDEA